jgi:hypothetical protein
MKNYLNTFSTFIGSIYFLHLHLREERRPDNPCRHPKTVGGNEDGETDENSSSRPPNSIFADAGWDSYSFITR